MSRPSPHPRIRPATSDADLAAATALFTEYAASLDFDLCFQDFERELATLATLYAPPDGCILLAEVAGDPCGCVAMRPHSAGTCEMKRLYVRPSARGRGIGRRLAVAVVERARERGYALMRLDTLASMVEAIALYESIGFREIAPYRHNPLGGARFYQLGLRAGAPPG